MSLYGDELEAVVSQNEAVTADLGEAKFLVLRGMEGAPGADGHSPYIGENGNWFVWDARAAAYGDSGVPAQGEPGGVVRIYLDETEEKVKYRDGGAAVSASDIKALTLAGRTVRLENRSATELYTLTGFFELFDMVVFAVFDSGTSAVNVTSSSYILTPHLEPAELPVPGGSIPDAVLHSVTANGETSLAWVPADTAKLRALAAFTEETGRVPLFTNVIPASIDSGGTVFNAVGYQDGKRINSSGALVDAADGFVTGFIPLPDHAQSMVMRFSGVHLIASGNSTNSRIQFYDANFNSISGSQTGQETLVVAETDSDGYITRINFADQTASQLIPTAAAKYVRFCAYGSGAGGVCTINEEIAYDEHGGTIRAALKPDVTVPQLEPLLSRITALENGAVDSADPLVKYAKQIDNGTTFGYEPSLTGRPTADLVAKKYLNFLHISDTHGSVNAENAVAILNKLKADGRCSFLIHTGDIHASTFADTASWNTFAGYLAQADAPVLLVSGNHDVGNNSQSTTDGTTATDAQLYARMFEPYVSDWDLTSHPSGKCYWYKDFSDEGVRLIGLYDFESDYAADSGGQLLYKRGYAAYHQAQIDWLVQALLTCPAGYGVIIAKHNPVNLRGTLDNPFNGEFLQGQNTAQTFVSSNMIPEIVQAFMDGAAINKTFAQTGNVTDTLTVNQDFSGKNTGAHFICYLDGHTHADGVSFLQDFPKQLELNIGCDNYHYQHYADTLNQQGTLHQDLLNYVSVDVNRGYVYIQRIGNDCTAQADRRDFTAIDYKHPPEAVDLDDLDARLDALESADDALETIADITFDGDTAFNISTDTNGQAFRLKKAVLLVENGNASANGSVSLQFRFSNVFVYRAYSSYSANQAGRVMFVKVWQENQRWYGQHTVFSANGFGTIYTQTETVANFLSRSVSTYPVIDNLFSGGWTPPQGTRAILLGVRA